ncbi:UNVERIFIED_CONTAM: hypothetical protein Cloal_1017 [Acetivibrio alkalicellulosi]
MAKSFRINELWGYNSPYKLNKEQSQITSTVYWQEKHQDDCYVSVDKKNNAKIIFNSRKNKSIDLGKLEINPPNYVIRDVATGGYLWAGSYNEYEGKKQMWVSGGKMNYIGENVVEVMKQQTSESYPENMVLKVYLMLQKNLNRPLEIVEQPKEFEEYWGECVIIEI